MATVQWFVMPGAVFGIQGRKFQKRGQNLCNQGCNIEVRGAKFKSGAQYWGPQGLDFLFLTLLAPGAGPAK